MQYTKYDNEEVGNTGRQDELNPGKELFHDLPLISDIIRQYLVRLLIEVCK